MLLITDLLPEIIENLGIKHIFIFIICTVIGYGILKLLDHFIPDHEESSMTKKDYKENLIHIGVITSCAFYQSNDNIWKTLSIIGFVSLSTFLGGLIMFFLNLTTISSILLGVLLSLTLGMLLFIVTSELIPRVKASSDKKTSYVGITIGVVLLLLSQLI